MTTDPTEKIEECETGYSLTIKSTRGTEPRDEDSVSVTAKTETLDELRARRAELNGVVSRTMDERRKHQPDTEDDD